MKKVPVRRRVSDVEQEALERGDRLRARFKILFSSDRTATDSLTCGIARIGPDTPLPRHRHEHSEVYFGLSGNALVTAGNEEYSVGPGVALFIPGNVEHAVHARESEAEIFFAFAADRYPDVGYVYLDED